MQRFSLAFFGVLSLFLILVPSAEAHATDSNGLVSGMIHPLLGLDHLLAMVAVGIIATQLGNKTTWALPITFVSFMIIGGMLAMSGFSLPFVETGIALSLLVLGVGIALSRQLPLMLSFGAIGLFALVHGHAHGTEIPMLASPSLYILGFISSTALLHMMGVLFGQSAQKMMMFLRLLRFSGVAMSFLGVFFLL